MITWDQLKHSIKNHRIQEKLYRTEKVQKKYDNFQKKIPSMSDYIRKKYLCDKSEIITVNLFPYNLEKNIDHYVLWHNSKISTQKVNKILQEYFATKNIQWYRSTRDSVPDIDHIHVFIQN